MIGETKQVAAEVALLRQQAEVVNGAVRVNLEGLTHADSLEAPAPAGNSANWILGHMAYTYEVALPQLGQEPVVGRQELARYRRGTPPLTDPDEARDFDDLLTIWIDSAQRFDAGLIPLTDDDLARRADYFGKGSQTSLSRYLGFILFHQAYHCGQLGVLRRVAGKEGAIA